MNDVINRKDAIGAILSVGHIAELSDGDAVIRVSAVNYVLRNLPSAQQEIKTGRWIYEETQYKISSYRCSECGRHVLYESKSDVCEAYPYCHCGAKMLKNDEVYANEWLGL